MILIERARDVIRVLAGERRIQRRNADAVGAVAGDAQARHLRNLCSGAVARGERCPGEERCDIGHVLLGELLRLRMHGEVRALAALVRLQGGDEVFGMLALELRDAVVRIGILVARHAVAAEAGVGDRFATDRIGLGSRLLGMQGKTCERTLRRARRLNAPERIRNPMILLRVARKSAPNLKESRAQMPE